MLRTTRHLTSLSKQSFGAVVLCTTLVFNAPITSSAQSQIADQNPVDQSVNKVEPSDLFFQAHLQLNKGKLAIEKGEFKLAWKNYNSALKYYQNLKLTHRLWKPDVVNYRIKTTNEVLEKIRPDVKKQLEKEQAAAQGIITGKKKIDLNKTDYDAPIELLNISKRVQLLQKDLEETRKHYEKKQTLQQAHLAAATGELEIWRKKNQKNPKIAAEIERRTTKRKSKST